MVEARARVSVGMKAQVVHSVVVEIRKMWTRIGVLVTSKVKRPRVRGQMRGDEGNCDGAEVGVRI